MTNNVRPTSSSSNEVYVVTIITSGYKSELHDGDINTLVFRSYDEASSAMRELATELYEEDPIIQEAHDKYFETYEDSIYFGENQSYGIGYRSAWGMVKLSKVDLQ